MLIILICITLAIVSLQILASNSISTYMFIIYYWHVFMYCTSWPRRGL